MRAKLLVFSVLLVLVPGVVFAALAFSSARRSLEGSIGRQLAEIAHDAAAIVHTEIAGEQARLRGWATEDVMRDLLVGDPDKRVAQFLSQMAHGSARYLALMCADASGTVVASSTPALVGKKTSERDVFGATEGDDGAVSEPYFVPLFRRRALRLSTPIPHPDRGGERIGNLFLLYDWDRNPDLFTHAQSDLESLGMPADILIVDARNVVVGGTWRPYLGSLGGTNLVAAGWRVAPTAGPNRTSRIEPAVDALVGHAPIHPLEGWQALALRPRADAFGPVRALQRQWVVLLAFVLLTAISVSAVWAQRLVRPLRRLIEATGRIGRADLELEPIPVSSRDEIGQLAEAFTAMAARLGQAQQDLLNATKFAFVGEMAAGVAHEIRTPLGVLRSSAQLLGRSLPAEAGRQKELVEMMVAEVDRLERVVAELLELARPRQPQLARVRLDEAIARAVEFVDARARERAVRLTLALDRGLLPALCDREQIYQVALNLLVNALQVLSPGGSIRVRTFGGDGTVGFAVEDDGPGIPAEMRERIFSPFFTTRADGTGLGLALVDRMVRANGGTVSVESEPGRGASFRVVLPAAADTLLKEATE